MTSRLPTLLFLSFPVIAACGGGGGGGEDPPDNAPPVMTVPGGLAGTSPSYRLTLPTGGAQTLVFTAVDPDGEPLLWQIGVPGSAATATGLTFTSPVAGPTFTLEVDTVTAPAAAPVTLLVEDPRGGAAAIDLAVVRSGAPSITGVAPNSAFHTLPQSVVISGGGLELGGTVSTTASFDGFAASNVVIVDETTLRCTTPAALAAGATIAAVGHQFGTAALPDTEFTVYDMPPSFAATDARLDAAAVVSFDVANDARTVHAVWHQGTAVVHEVSTDSGAVWSAETPISGAESASEPQVVVDGDDVGIVWIGDGNTVWFTRSTNGGTSFETPQRLDDTTGPVVAERRPRLCQSGDRWYAAWIQGSSGSGTARVVAIASADRGETWVERATVSDVANQDNHLLGCSGNAVWIVMEDERLGPGLRGIYAVQSPNGGADWGIPRRLNLPNTSASQPRMAYASNRAHVAWVQADTLQYSQSPDAGLTWSNAPLLIQDAATGVVGAPSIAGDTNRVCFAYTINGATVWSARIPQFGAQVQRTQVETVTTPSAETSLHLTGNYAYVLWREGDVGTGAARIQAAISGDGTATFAFAGGFGDGTATQQAGRLLHDGARLFVAWLDSRTASVGLFTNRITQ